MPAKWRPAVGACHLLAAVALAGAAAAQPAPSACAPENLLTGEISVYATGVTGRSRLLVDGRAASEGDPWDGPLSVRFAAPDGELRIDLGALRTTRSALVQADADETYLLEGSTDGVEFELLGTAAALPALSGLRTRAVTWPARELRQLRLRFAGGDGRASISEVQLFCVEPSDWRPDLAIFAQTPDPGGRRPDRRWNDVTSRWWELALALGGMVFLAFARRAEAVRGERVRRRWNAAFGALFGLALLTYFNFGAFHFGNYLHNWDTFHYYLGAKYFPELRYDGLYDCVAVADAAADPARRSQVAERRIRDLSRNLLVPASGILATPQRCTARFSDARWRDFQSDVAWFRARESPGRWNEMSADHGFNATPVWMLAGSTLARLAPATDRSIFTLSLLDPLYFLGMAAVLVWGFGLRASAVALLVLATSFPSRFYWTGGAFLRWDWLFFVAAAAALLRRGHALAAGAALGYAALLRLFPTVLIAGPALALAGAALAGARQAAPGRALRGALAALGQAHGRVALRFLAGVALAATVLVPASFAVGGGPSVWREFAVNTAKHRSTPLTNNMGLSFALTYRPTEIGRRLHDERAAEPWARWKAARLAARERMQPIQLLLLAAALALLAAAVRPPVEPWVGLALAAALIPFAVEMTCYYYAFLLLPALLWLEKRAVATTLLALSAAGQLLSLAPMRGMPTWRDELYTALSAATVLALAGILLQFARRRAVPRA